MKLYPSVLRPPLPKKLRNVTFLGMPISSITSSKYFTLTQKAYQIYIPKKRTVIWTVHVHFNVNTNMANSFQTEGEIQFQYNSSLPSRNLMTPMTMIPPWNLHHPLPLLTCSSKSLHLHLFPRFWNMFQMFPTFLLHNLIHQLTIHVNPLSPPWASSSCIITATNRGDTTSPRRLDSPTLFPSQQIILMLMQSQMLIQGEYLLLMKKQMNRN
jgi:hypothetical protein